ncbi:MAG TPA: response regulator [Kofleriaceae bacterium]|jgi:CheY-like chemotaxis protein|nr:response regulator [Kofleriaceae bacterium]
MTRALVVDDTPLNLKLVVALLRANGFAVESAESAEQARDKLAEAPFEVVLLDLRLPGMDGLELTRCLRADPAQRGLVIVAVTANAMKTDEAAALEAGCDAFVTKPIDTRALVPLLRKLTRRS